MAKSAVKQDSDRAHQDFSSGSREIHGKELHPQRLVEERVEDTFAECFDLKMSRILISAPNRRIARETALQTAGFGVSVIMCPAQCGVESFHRTMPDGRPGYSVLIAHPNAQTLKDQLLARISQCILTSPGCACFDGTDPERVIDKTDAGKKTAYFGEGYQQKITRWGRTLYIIPVMAGEFIVESEFGIGDASDGNFQVWSSDFEEGLSICRKVVSSIRKVKGLFLLGATGIISAGSKVGSVRYKSLKASTAHLYCPTIRSRVPESRVPSSVGSIFEICMVGWPDAVKRGMKRGMMEALRNGALRISAGNYGGNLGRINLHLRDLLLA